MNAIGEACKFTMKRASCVTKRVHIAWTQTGHHSILKPWWCKQLIYNMTLQL